jgi:tetratricopeptide (TPR) repeat protein
MRTVCRALTALILLVAAPLSAQHQHGAPATAPSADGVPLFDDLGTHHHAITTRVPEAQRYFDQGLRLVYAFNHDEAIRAFREAARLDPTCAMAWWGVALASGPNYNLPLDPEREAAALDAVARGMALADHASARERQYLDAVAIRYGNAPGGDRKALDRAYAEAMKKVMQDDPGDADAAVIYAEALMVLRPWDLWTLDGHPNPGTEEIVEVLEGVLAKAPDHPGANHYYIHAVEASRTPERALDSARRVGGLMPGAGHIVHMPSHIYMRTGRWEDAAAANERAIVVDQRYIESQKPGGVYPMMYYPHNIHFLWSAASMQGRSGDALAAARTLGGAITPEMMRAMPMLEFFWPTTAYGLVRFGRWDEVLAEPAPGDEFAYATGMWHYARGMAFAGKGRYEDAARERALVDAAAQATPIDRLVADNQPARRQLELASAVLAGESAARRGDGETAVRELERAVVLEDALPYMEPPAWYYPVRQSLGAALLAAGRADEAEAVYREDLRRNPENGWSLYGLAESLRADGDARAAAAVDRRFRAAWTRADVKLAASRF